MAFPDDVYTPRHPLSGTSRNSATIPLAGTVYGIEQELVRIEDTVGTLASTDPNSMGYRVSALEAALSTLGAWTSWTPAVTQSTSVSLTATGSRYCKFGRLVIAQAAIAVTGSGTASNAIIISLPVTSKTLAGGGWLAIGSWGGVDTGTQVYSGEVVWVSTTTCALVISSSGGVYVGQTPAWTLANTDTIGFTIAYEAAA